MNKFKLTNKEHKLLEDLLDFNRQLEKVFFSKEKDEEIIDMIDEVIDQKLKRINPLLAYKMLNTLYKDKILDKYHSREIKIINNLPCDLAKERLGLLLLKIALSNKEYINYRKDANTTTGLNNYLDTNMLNFSFVDIPIINYCFSLDHAEIFLGYLNNDDEINKDLCTKITNKFLFIYKDLYLEFKRRPLNINSTPILANRYDVYTNLYLNSDPTLRDTVSITPFCQEAIEMLKIKDSEITDWSTLIIGKHYLDSFTNHLSETGYNKLTSNYNLIEEMIDLTNHYEALNYIHTSLKGKNKSYELSSHNF